MTLSNHKGGSDEAVLWVLALGTCVEIPVFHLIARHWSRMAAWMLSGLGIAAFFYLVVLAVSFRRCPVVLDGRFLLLRLGVAQRRRIERAAIDSVGPLARATSRSALPKDLRLTRFWLIDPPNVAVRYRGAKGVEQIEFRVDEPARLIAALA